MRVHLQKDVSNVLLFGKLLVVRPKRFAMLPRKQEDFGIAKLFQVVKEDIIKHPRRQDLSATRL
jgi:hypothetical protein